MQLLQLPSRICPQGSSFTISLLAALPGHLAEAMALNALKPYEDICSVAFAVSRIRRSARQRFHSGELDGGKSDAIHIVIEIFFRAHADATADHAKGMCGGGFNYLIEKFPAAVQVHRRLEQESGGYSIIMQAREVATRGVEVMLRHQNNEAMLSISFYSLSRLLWVKV